MYVRERLRRVNVGRFIEVGVGDGSMSNLLLELGWTGTGYDLSDTAIANAGEMLGDHVEAGDYNLICGNFLDADVESESVDLVISSMVIEHLDDSDEARYLAKARDVLSVDGMIIVLVPASERHWGIEDEIAGHFRRYTLERLRSRLSELNWNLSHIAGLTFPVSNALLPLSNKLVERSERDKLAQSIQERTESSGHREVFGKTSFPKVATLVLNERVMSPFHWLQKRNTNNPNSLIIYAEAQPKSRQDDGN